MDIENEVKIKIKVRNTNNLLCHPGCKFFTMDYGSRQCIIWHDLGSKKHELKNSNRCDECLSAFKFKITIK